MRPLALAVVAFAAALGTIGAVRYDRSTHVATRTCYDAAESPVEFDRCASADALASRRHVDAAFAALDAMVSGAERRLVEADQRAWRAYVEANCRSASNVALPRGGSLARFSNLVCLQKRNAERVAYLRWRAVPLPKRVFRRIP